MLTAALVAALVAALAAALAAAVAATPGEKEQAAPLVQATRDSKTAEVAEAGADREGKCKFDSSRHIL